MPHPLDFLPLSPENPINRYTRGVAQLGLERLVWVQEVACSNHVAPIESSRFVKTVSPSMQNIEGLFLCAQIFARTHNRTARPCGSYSIILSMVGFVKAVDNMEAPKVGQLQ